MKRTLIAFGLAAAIVAPAHAELGFRYGETTCPQVVEFVEVGSQTEDVNAEVIGFHLVLSYVNGTMAGAHLDHKLLTVDGIVERPEIKHPYVDVSGRQIALDIARWCKENPTEILLFARAVASTRFDDRQTKDTIQ
jgi:hypothetical protein